MFAFRGRPTLSYVKSVKSGGDPSAAGRLGWQAAQLPLSGSSNSARPRSSAGDSLAVPARKARTCCRTGENPGSRTRTAQSRPRGAHRPHPGRRVRRRRRLRESAPHSASARGVRSTRPPSRSPFRARRGTAASPAPPASPRGRRGRSHRTPCPPRHGRRVACNSRSGWTASCAPPARPCRRRPSIRGRRSALRGRIPAGGRSGRTGGRTRTVTRRGTIVRRALRWATVRASTPRLVRLRDEVPLNGRR